MGLKSTMNNLLLCTGLTKKKVSKYSHYTRNDLRLEEVEITLKK